jgi:DNA-binding winged helix-turn-helix (wHTH) protein/predicted ATPase
MSPSPQWIFGPFRLDPANACLWRGDQLIALRPKPFAVLSLLVTHAGQLVTKETLFEAIWPETAVSDTVLKICIRQIRQALGDAAQIPQFIVTVHRRGYRFIAPTTVLDRPPPEPIPPLSTIDALILPQPASPRPPSLLIDRGSALRQLHTRLEAAAQGSCQVIFVTGEPGIGKTALVETFADQAARDPRVRFVWGQCTEHYGAAEAYMSVLEAVSQLCRGMDGGRVVATLRQHAPTWLVQMPWLLTPGDRDLLQYELRGATRERMLRELAAAVEMLTAEATLVLVLEDLHWSDHATLDSLALLARRREPTRLLLVGTYRPVEAIVHAHPLLSVKQDLVLHGHATELPLAPLSETAVATYLTARFPGLIRSADLPQWVYRRTDGNPLFLRSVVEHLVAQGILVHGAGRWELRTPLTDSDIGVPESLRQMIAQQLNHLTPEEQQIIEVASVRGMEFSADVVAAGLDGDIETVEACCDGLVRRGHVLRAVGDVMWPNGTATTRYAFHHVLYQQVAYEHLGAAWRMRLHRRVGAALEEALGARAPEMAAELAMHFERGREHARAVCYLRQAAETASQRHAHREAIEYLRRALELLKILPDRPERDRQELEVYLALGPAQMITQGFASPAVAHTYGQAHQLCEQLGDTQQLFPVLFGQWRSVHVRAQLETAREFGEQLLTVAERQGDPALFVEAHGALGQTLCVLGEPTLAQEHLRQVVALYEPQRHSARALRFGYDPGIYAHAMEGWVLWLLGYPEQALQRSHDGLALAREQSHPFTLALTLATVAILQQMRQEGEVSLEQVAASLALSSEHGFPYLRAAGTVLQGWGLARFGQVDEGIAQMRQGLAAMRATGAEILRPYLLALLAEAHGSAGQIEAGLYTLEEALVAAQDHAERFYEAELHRLKGELLLRKFVGAALQPTSPEPVGGIAGAGGATGQLSRCIEAEASFQCALEIARQQGAKSLELRAAMSLSRCWTRQDKGAAARQLLSEVYSWFTEGFDTADLQAARALLGELVDLSHMWTLSNKSAMPA